MKKIILPILTLVVAVSVLFTGCGSSSIGYYRTKTQAMDNSYSTYTDLSVALDGATVKPETMTENGNVVVSKEIEGVVHFGVFNVLEGTYKLALGNVTDIQIISAGAEGDYFVVNYKVEEAVKSKLVKATGEVLYENVDKIEFHGARTVKKANYEAWVYTKDGFSNLEVIKIKKGQRTVNYSVNNGVGNPISIMEFVWGGTYSGSLVDYVAYSKELANGNTLYQIVNKKGNVVSEYELDVQYLSSAVIVGEYLFVQYLYPVDPYSTKFDVLKGEEKFKVETVRISIKSGKTKALGNFNYLLNDAEHNGEDFARVEVEKIENKLPVGETFAFLTKEGKIKEAKFAYNDVHKIAENVNVAENNAGDFKIFQIIDNAGNVLCDLSARNTDYDYVTHCDKFIVVKDVEKNKYGVIDLAGKLIVPFEYDESFGVVNDVWLATKKTENATDATKITTYYSVDANGTATKQSEKTLNSEDALVSNKLGDMGIVELSTLIGSVAIVKSNAEQASKYNYMVVGYNNLISPLTTFANVDELTINAYKVNPSGKQILIIAGAQVGILR